MWPDRVSNPGPPTYESGALPIALRGPADDLAFMVLFNRIKLKSYLDNYERLSAIKSSLSLQWDSGP